MGATCFCYLSCEVLAGCCSYQHAVCWDSSRLWELCCGKCSWAEQAGVERRKVSLEESYTPGHVRDKLRCLDAVFCGVFFCFVLFFFCRVLLFLLFFYCCFPYTLKNMQKFGSLSALIPVLREGKKKSKLNLSQAAPLEGSTSLQKEESSAPPCCCKGRRNLWGCFYIKYNVKMSSLRYI